MTVLEKLNDLKEYLSSSKKMLGKSVIDVEKIKEIVSDIESSLPLELEQSRVIISQKESNEAFEAFKNNAIQKYNFIKDVEIADNTIEEK